MLFDVFFYPEGYSRADFRYNLLSKGAVLAMVGGVQVAKGRRYHESSKRLGDQLGLQVRTEDGVLVDESPVSASLDYLHGHGSLIAGLEKALEGHEAGDHFDVKVGANEAYGNYDENLVRRVPKDVFMGVDELQVGMRFLADTDQGQVPVEITEVDGDHVVVDGNHMLAGQNLNFNVEVVAIREATPEELAHGHVHGEHDRHHEQGDGCCGGHGDDHDHGKKGGCSSCH